VDRIVKCLFGRCRRQKPDQRTDSCEEKFDVKITRARTSLIENRQEHEKQNDNIYIAKNITRIEPICISLMGF
jgi:hypothetical protein